MLFNQSSGRPPYLGHAHGEDILQVSLHKMFSLFAVLVGKRHREMPVCQADCLIRGNQPDFKKEKKNPDRVQGTAWRKSQKRA